MKKIVVGVLIVLLNISFVFSKDKIKIGVTLQPYYSFVANITGDKADIVPVVRGDLYDLHNYQPTFEDIQKLSEVDVLVVNGIGHDEFVFEMLSAVKNKDSIKVIFANENVSLMPVGGTRNNEKILNPHTFISITTSIQQINTIMHELSKIDPKNRTVYRKNARAYTRKLQKLKTDALEKVVNLEKIDIRVATTHAGYDYLLSEFGIDVKAVVEPAHGAQPSATDLKNIIDILEKEKLDVLFADAVYKGKFVETIERATGIAIRSLSHMTNGPYVKDGFEKFIQQNLDSVVDTMIFVAEKKRR